MTDYKALKEAFHADNPGGPVLEVLGVSFICATSYLLYASVASVGSGRLSVASEYATTVLPLLLAVTLFADRPFTWQAILIAASLVALHLRRTSEGRLPKQPATQLKKGQWLEESDSDEEPSQAAPVAPAGDRSTKNGVLLPSQIVGRSTSVITDGHGTETSSPDTLSPDSASKDGLARQRSFRRHSPTPSTHTHTAIDILPTPELRPSTLSRPDVSYPRPSSAQATTVEQPQASLSSEKPGTPQHAFLTVYRAHMMVMTIHCILAVDFPVFPRALGKCETFGTSVMDIGVGSFVFSLGIVSFRSMTKGGRMGPMDEIWTSFRRAAPVLALGLIRVVMVKGTEYPEHVTEYGVHWNFFVTLGLVPLLAILLRRLKRRWMRWSMLGLLLSVFFKWQDWVLGDERKGLFGMNKEGLVSLPGYLAIFILGLSAGQHVLRASSPTSAQASASGSESTHIAQHREKRRTELVLELFSYSIAYWILFAGSLWLSPVSRCLANLPYVLFIAGFNTTGLLSYLAIERAFFANRPDLAVPRILGAVNKNGLALFLLANLATGAVNLSMRTMYASTPISMAVLSLYSAGVIGVAWIGRGLRLKLL